jgi:hypothetical protein
MTHRDSCNGTPWATSLMVVRAGSPAVVYPTQTQQVQHCTLMVLLERRCPNQLFYVFQFCFSGGTRVAANRISAHSRSNR